MSHDALLQTFAQVFIALLGFTGIVAAIGRSRHERDRIERARLESLLTVGAEGAVFAVAPLVAVSAGIDPGLVWRTGNGVVALLHLCGAIRFVAQIGPAHWLDRGPERISTFLLPIPAGLICAQLAVALGFAAPLGPFFYLATLLWFVLVGMLQFVFLFVRTRES